MGTFAVRGTQRQWLDWKFMWKISSLMHHYSYRNKQTKKKKKVLTWSHKLARARCWARCQLRWLDAHHQLDLGCWEWLCPLGADTVGRLDHSAWMCWAPRLRVSADLRSGFLSFRKYLFVLVFLPLSLRVSAEGEFCARAVRAFMAFLSQDQPPYGHALRWIRSIIIFTIPEALLCLGGLPRWACWSRWFSMWCGFEISVFPVIVSSL